MPSGLSILIGGTSAADLAASMQELDVEESVDMPGAFSMTLPVNRTPLGDYDIVNDPRLAPLSNLSIVVAASDGRSQCLFDGFVLSQSAHLDTGTVASTVKVWGQDATWLMNTTERAREWPDISDGQVANSIFADYNIIPGDNNLSDDSPAHTSDTHTLMQRATDAQFLRRLARRNGKLFRVSCTDTPGLRTGTFARPALSGAPATTLTLNDATAATIDSVDISWDVMRPSSTTARQTLFTDHNQDGAGGTTDESGLALLSDRSLNDFASTPVASLLTSTVDDGQELTQRAQSLLMESGWFVRCQGTADAGRLGSILRAGTIASLQSAGSLHSGNYFVWSVRHKITSQRHTMNFTLVRNAVGAPAAPGPLAGGLSL